MGGGCCAFSFRSSSAQAHVACCFQPRRPNFAEWAGPAPASAFFPYGLVRISSVNRRTTYGPFTIIFVRVISSRRHSANLLHQKVLQAGEAIAGIFLRPPPGRRSGAEASSRARTQFPANLSASPPSNQYRATQTGQQKTISATTAASEGPSYIPAGPAPTVPARLSVSPGGFRPGSPPGGFSTICARSGACSCAAKF